MQIPTSVIVMSVLTAVPFGLAIRDSVEHHADTEADELDFDGSREQRRAMERYEAEARQEQQAAREASEKSKHDLARVIGPTPASFGSLFQGLRLGVERGAAPEAVRNLIDTAETERHAAFQPSFELDSAGTINGLTIQVYDSCDDFGSTLASAWGVSSDQIWIDRAAQQRASFDSIGCTLLFERVVDPEQWIDKTDTAVVPLGAIGQPTSKVIKGDLGGLDEQGDGEITSYTAPGIGRGKQGTTIDVYGKKGKVTGLKVSVATDKETADQVLARLTKLYGMPKHDAVYGYSDWKGKLPIHFETTSTHLLIQAGSISQ